MIAVDSSSFISYLQGQSGPDIDQLDMALEAEQVVLPPMVVMELLSDPKLGATATQWIMSLPMMEVQTGFWLRAGQLRAQLKAHKMRVRVADAMIAQMCLDHDIRLLSRDRDFRHFVKLAGLRLVA